MYNVELEVGDLVKVKGTNSPEMVVNEIDTGSKNNVLTFWFTTSHEKKSAWFDYTLLEKS